MVAAASITAVRLRRPRGDNGGLAAVRKLHLVLLCAVLIGAGTLLRLLAHLARLRELLRRAPGDP